MPRTKAIDLSSCIHEIMAGSDDTVRRAALFEFVSYLQWPAERDRAIASALFRRVNYAAASKQPPDPGDLDKLMVLVLNDEFLDLTDDLRFRNLNAELVAQIVRFIISYKPDSKLKTDQASVNKAYYALLNGAYGRKWKISKQIFEASWRVYKPVCGFHYVNEVVYRRIFNVDVHDPTFSAKIDDLLCDRDRLDRYFSQSMWVYGQLQEILYASAFRGVRLPVFPAELRPLAITIQPTEPRLKEMMKEYRS